MITQNDLQEAIAECQGQRNPTANTAIKLAAFLTIQKELYGAAKLPSELNNPSAFYSFSPPSETKSKDTNADVIGDYGNSDFLQSIKGKSSENVWKVMDEIMDMLKIVNERAYNGYMRRLK